MPRIPLSGRRHCILGQGSRYTKSRLRVGHRAGLRQLGGRASPYPVQMTQPARGTPNPRDVFVVHGRNEALRSAIFTFLRSLDLNPIEWSVAVSMTETGSPYIGDILDAAFERAQAVVVLLTPDEIAHLQPRFASGDDDPETQPAPQARPNVLFEAGMAIARHPRHTILVEVGAMRSFSDVSGRHTIRLSNGVSSRQELATRLRTAGCAVSVDGTDWHTAGDLTAPSPPGDGLPLGRRIPSTRVAKRLDFDVKYHPSGSSSEAGRLQVINRGSETAYEVSLEFPLGAALAFLGEKPKIAKIPGGGRAVTVSTWNQDRFMGGSAYSHSFDVTVSARTEDGESFSQEVFLDAYERG